MKKVQRPRLMDTGSFSQMSVDTALFWKKLVPRSKRANWPSICKKRSWAGLSKPYKALISSNRFGSTP